MRSGTVVRAVCVAILALPASALAGDGTFPEDRAFTVPIAFAAQDMAVGDFDGDGKVDLAVTTGGDVEVATGDGEGGFNPPEPVNATGNPHAIAVGDFNADGDEDLAVSANTQV